MNTSAFGVEKATLIRYPSTANLMIDSKNRNPIQDSSGVNISSPWNYTLSRKQQLINGFFTRVGTTEVCLEWCANNISDTLGNRGFSIIDSSGATHNVDLLQGLYNAEECLDALVAKLDGLGLPGYTFTVNVVDGQVLIESGGPTFAIKPTKLAYQLGLNPFYPTPQGGTPVNTSQEVGFFLSCVDLRPYRYLDFVCEQLTAVQDVKDASSALETRDVLCRWYFADDVPNQLDSLGFPVLQGYTKFATRRIFNPPKQIKWEQNTPVGGFLQFVVYGDDGKIVSEANDDAPNLSFVYESNWLMTLQLSEG
jgi:hypothetical protein